MSPQTLTESVQISQRMLDNRNSLRSLHGPRYAELAADAGQKGGLKRDGKTMANA